MNSLSKVHIMTNVLNKKECNDLLLCNKNGIFLKELDIKLNRLIYNKVKNTNKYIELNSKYQIVQYNDNFCDLYKYNHITSELYNNWVMYICLNDECQFVFNDVDVNLDLGCGVLVPESDHDYQTEHSYYLLSNSDSESSMLMKRFF